MHKVIKNLKARAGKNAPHADGRRIALVLYGGNMIGIRSAAALVIFEKMKLNQAFDVIYTVSAGFPMAAYFLTNQMRFVFPMYYQELTTRRFINFWRLTRMIDMNYLLQLMQTKYRLDLNKLYIQATDLYVRFRNIQKNTLEYFRAQDSPRQDFWKLMEAAVSLPFFNPGCVEINGCKYMDTVFFTDNLSMHLNQALNSDATDILVIYNHAGQIQNKNDNNHQDQRVFALYLDKDTAIGHFTRNQTKLLSTAQAMCDLVANEFEYEKINISNL